jgi:hypothetical protein
VTLATPTAVELILLVLAAYRLYRFLALDSFPPMMAARTWLTGEDDEGHPTGARRPKWIADLWACPFCLGYWISLALVAGWWVSPMWAIAFALPWAVSAGAALVTARLDPS